MNRRDSGHNLHSRRSALRTICSGFLAASGLNQLIDARALAKQETGNGELAYKIYGWTGDDFTLGHRLRDKKFDSSARKVEKTVDFVIVGGGIAGLSLAHFLQDHDFLLLEQYSDLGGQARGDLTGKTGFSYGSTWMASIEGELGQLLDAVGLPTQKLNPIGWGLIWNDQAKAHMLNKEFKRILASCLKSAKTVGKSFAFSTLGDNALLELDKLPFEKVVDVQTGECQNLIDNYFRSVACCSTKTASALAGLQLMQQFALPRHALPGGNATFAEALKSNVSAKHPGALLTNVFVWAVELQDSGALVTYSDDHGEFHTIAAKHVAITAPPMVASRILSNLNNKARIPLLRQHYGSYLVGNIQLGSSFADHPYQSYSSNLSGLAEIDSEKSRLTLKHPFEPGSDGRTLLLEGDQQVLAQSLDEQLRQCMPGKKFEIKSITLSRWGHAIAAPLPGYYAIASQIAANQQPSLSFSHCSTAGIASLEAAVEAARQAADRALGKEGRKSISYSI